MKKPDLSPRIVELELSYVNKLLGVNLKPDEVKALLERMRFGVKASGGKLSVSVPAYRTDILHPIDLVEDVAISYGYMNFKPELPKLSTVGKADSFELLSDELRDHMVGLGFTEVMTLVMTSKTDLFQRMNLPEQAVAETVNSLSQDHSVCRNWLLPSLMGVLGKNKNREYPQRLFEIGDCISPDGRDGKRLCGVIAHSKASFSEVKAMVAGLLESLKLDSGLSEVNHESFAAGRCARTKDCIFGEVNPLVLQNFSLEIPVSAFELDLSYFKQVS
ncbi:MAG: hypothetical protein NTU61_06515 [Candidatus Altiarchaeota archaeon]|nr:hypothetical protein [Candidatus Altiarchaeota archaeon]